MNKLVFACFLLSSLAFSKENDAGEKYAIVVDVISDAFSHQVDDNSLPSLNDEVQSAVNDSVNFWDKLKECLGF